MPEVTIKYKSPKTLKALQALSELLDFTISKPAEKKTADFIYINDVPIIPGNRSIDISDMPEIIGRNKMNAKAIRQSWQRNK